MVPVYASGWGSYASGSAVIVGDRVFEGLTKAVDPAVDDLLNAADSRSLRHERGVALERMKANLIARGKLRG